ncbi:MAG: SulP family inorganic anion transporter, partial [Anaerolineales bacterium]
MRNYRFEYLRPDLLAALTVAIIMLPQAIAFALIAELPPEMGLYTAIFGSIIAGLWGASHHLQTGPTNTISLLTLSALLAVAKPDSSEYLVAAGILAMLVGLFHLVMGLARLGILVNFVSDSVIVGFTAGAGILIFVNQLRNLLRLDIQSTPGLTETLKLVASHIQETHLISLGLGLGAVVLIVLLKQIKENLPGPLLAILLTSILVAVLKLDQSG